MPENILKPYREQGLMPGVFRWLDEEVKRPDAEVVGVGFRSHMRETTFDQSIYSGNPLSPWRTFAPMGMTDVTLEFRDGTNARETFTDQELGMTR